MKTLLRLSVVAGSVFALATCASAEIFVFNATLSDSSTIAGAINIDTIGGTITSIDLAVQDDPGDMFNQILAQADIGPAYLEITTTAANPGTFPAVFLGLLNPSDPGTLLGFTGGPGSVVTGVGGSTYAPDQNTFLTFTSASLDPVPEPRFGAALAIGLVAMAFLGRRKRKALTA